MTQPFKPYLPGVLSLIKKTIGEDMAVKVAKARGGQRLYIPDAPKGDHVLSQIVGLENARKLSKVMGSGRIDVPCGNIGGEAGRRERAAQLLKQGMSFDDVAAEVDLHRRTVERVAALQGLGPGAQKTLFD